MGKSTIKLLIYLPTSTAATSLLRVGAFADLCKSYTVVFAFHEANRAQLGAILSGSSCSESSYIWLSESRGRVPQAFKRILLVLNTARLCQYWIAKRVNPLTQWKFFNRKKSWQFIVAAVAVLIPPLLLRVIIRVFSSLAQPSLYQQLNVASYDLVVVSASAMDIYSDFAITLAKRHGVSSLAYVTHWDFFSKKTFLNDYPDVIGVWGAYMRQEAMKDKNLSASSDIQILSAPLIVSSPPYPPLETQVIRVLYACGSLPYPDKSILMRLSDYIDGYIADGGQNIEVIYRPHPRSKYSLGERDIEALEKSKNITVDASVKSQGLEQLSIEYPDHASSCHAVITPFSTMGLEFLLRAKPCMFLAYNNGQLKDVYSSCMASSRARLVMRHPLSLGCGDDSRLESVFGKLISLATDTAARIARLESLERENEGHAGGGCGILSHCLESCVNKSLRISDQ